MGVAWVCSQGRGQRPSSRCRFFYLSPHLLWIAAQSPENEALSRSVAALLRSLMIWELVIGGPGAALGSAWLPILFPWLVLGLLWVC